MYKKMDGIIKTLLILCMMFMQGNNDSVFAGNESANNEACDQKNEKVTMSTSSEKTLEHHLKNTFTFHPIGIFHSPLTPETGAPRQGRFAPDIKAKIEVGKEFVPCLEGLEEFKYIIVVFVFDRSHGWSAKVTPPGASKARGVFATRAPRRPCQIGITVVKLEKRDGRFLHVSGVDAFDQTPVLDIKPYVASIDYIPGVDRDAEKELGIDRKE